jgi:hypothetical protein
MILRTSTSTCLLLVVASVILNGCGRASITALSKQQDAYYSDLEGALTKQQDLFTTAIDAQLQADQSRRRQILGWQIGLSQADILLQSASKPPGKQSLLLQKTAQLDIAYQGQSLELSNTEIARAEALKQLYSALQKATLAAQKNNEALTDYLSSSSDTFALKSIDAGGVSLAVTSLEARVDQLRGVTEKTTAQEKAEQSQLQTQIEQAQNVLVKVLENQSGKP